MIEYSNIYSKTWESLLQYYRDEPALEATDDIIDFPADNNDGILLNIKEKIAQRIGNDGKKDVEVMVSLKYLSNFWRTLEIPLINCEMNLMLTWSPNCFLVAGTVTNKGSIFTKADTKLYVPVVM